MNVLFYFRNCMAYWMNSVLEKEAKRHGSACPNHNYDFPEEEQL